MRTTKAVQKIILAGGEIAEARFMAATSKWNAITSVSVFALSSGVNLHKWFQGIISFKEFIQVELVQAGGSLGSFSFGVAGSKIGISIGTFFGPIGAVIGGALGGILGAIGGQVGGEQLFNYLSEWIPWLENDDQKGLLSFCQVMLMTLLCIQYLPFSNLSVLLLT